MTPDLITNVVTGLPNLAVAVWCIWNYQKTIDKLIDQENKLLDQLLTLVQPTSNLRSREIDQSPE